MIATHPHHHADIHPSSRSQKRLNEIKAKIRKDFLRSWLAEKKNRYKGQLCTNLAIGPLQFRGPFLI